MTTQRALVEKSWRKRASRWKLYALALTRNPADAEDVVQEALARTLRAKPRLATESDAHSYILTAVKTTALQLVRERRRFVGLGKLKLKHGAHVASSPLMHVLEAEAREKERLLWQLTTTKLPLLRPEHREVLELLVLRDPPLKLREVAEIQGVAISTVHSRFRRALRQLAQAIESAEEREKRERVS